MKICIIGTGYVGLVTGACFAQTGNTVYCVDKDQDKINKLKDGIIPIFEPGLEDLVKNNVAKNRLHFTTSLADSINQADVSFIAVGTPQDKDGSADLKYVKAVCEEICQVATKKVVIATKSTVPVGTGDQIEAIFKEKLGHEYVVFSNPEFLKEGDAVNDFMKPDRVVIGLNEDGQHVKDQLNELYAPFNHQKERVIFMSRRSAEITKYAANSMLALRISFMNEMANFCDAAGADINDVRRGIGSDPRIGSAFLYPGLGYGGSCFPKDVKAMIKAGTDHGMTIQTLEATDEVNQHQVRVFFDKICGHYGDESNLKGKHFAVWGLAFKARTDDIRESQAIRLIDLLVSAGATVTAFDPEAMPNTKSENGDKMEYAANAAECMNNADALVIATDWNEFKSPDFDQIKSTLKSPTIFDARNLYNAKYVKGLGFEYVGVGVR